MKIKRLVLPIIAAALALSLCGCAGKGISALSSVMGSYGDTSFELVSQSESYNFTTDIFIKTTEPALYASASTVVRGKVTSVDEIKVCTVIPMEQAVEGDAEDGEGDTAGFSENDKKTETVNYDVTAYIGVISFVPDKIYADASKALTEGEEIRVLTRISSRMWDSLAVPLEKGDECVLYLSTSDSDTDIMKIYDRGIAAYVLYDSHSGIVKKTADGWLFSAAHEYMTENAPGAKAYDKPYTESVYYKNEQAYLSFAEDMYIADEVDAQIENNVKYYYG